MKSVPLIILLFLLRSAVSFGESLWEENFQGLLSEQNFLKKGQVLQVVIESETSFSFSSSSVGNKKVTLEFTGGEGGDLFSFLPSGSSSESGSRKGSEDLSMKAVLSARVRDFDDSGMAFISGSRTVVFLNGTEEVSIQGWINPSDVDTSMSVPLSRVSDARFVFSSFLDPAETTISAGDLQERAPAGAGPLGDTGAEVTSGPEIIAGGESPGTDEGEQVLSAQEPSGYTLNDARKKELLLSYINRFLDIIFLLEQ